MTRKSNESNWCISPIGNLPQGSGARLAISEVKGPTQIGFKLNPDEMSLLQLGIAPGESSHQAARRILLTRLSEPDLWFLSWYLGEDEMNEFSYYTRGTTPKYRFVVVERQGDHILGFLQQLGKSDMFEFISLEAHYSFPWVREKDKRHFLTFDQANVWEMIEFPITGTPHGMFPMCECVRRGSAEKMKKR